MERESQSLWGGLYRVVANALFFLSCPFLLLFILSRPRADFGLRQRLGREAPGCRRRRDGGPPRVWIHAASVGEVAAAGVLIRELTADGRQLDIVLTTMTVQGLRVAREQLADRVCAFLAPLDVPWIVRRVVNLVRPDLYVCLETELWPAMLIELRQRRIGTILLNGRMTDRSFRRYRMARAFLRPLLEGFAAVAAISTEDGARFAALGVLPERIRVTGNIKFDFPVENSSALRQEYRKKLGVDREAVFLCGSTRNGEEQLLAGVYQALAGRTGGEWIWVIAPRHLRRLAKIKEVLADKGLAYDLYSELAQGRRHQVVLVDCLGELARLYSAGDFNFVGGSLADRGGHNLMEAVRWGRPVYYGPHIDDFRDAAHILELAGAGFRVEAAEQLTGLLARHRADADAYRQACAAAASVAASQQGTAARQATIITHLLPGSGRKEQDSVSI